ncbi:hypothetical protein LX99_04561 [Mucilaginibacter oryzae]|uniref:Uncharacterized protein n=1 Tax=Mucilaginibacter oryzae TaxID=468058 RepID=A0A316HFR3_9SPHI|nr:hypothetical protein [Mucilaginibacter oryzae]PWK70853.1 hypothetical protein LX99_04561 [Mucilaginibacter oryzae]
MWEIEDIPPSNKLYVRVHKNNINPKTAEPRPAAFKNTPEKGPDLSSDWEKHSTPQSSRDLIGKQFKYGTEAFKNPNDFFIVSFTCEKLSCINPPQSVQHTPQYNNPEIVGEPNNRAHASIIGDKSDEEIRLKFIDIYNWEIKPNI